MSQARADRVTRLLELEGVRRQAILEIPRDGSFDPVAEIARRIVGCKAAVIDIVDREHLFELSDPVDNPENHETQPVRFASVASDDGEWPGEGASFHAREAADPVRARELGFGFYAGLPLRTADGHMLGTLALVDPQPHAVGEAALDSLKLLARLVVDMLELRLAARANIAAASR